MNQVSNKYFLKERNEWMVLLKKKEYSAGSFVINQMSH